MAHLGDPSLHFWLTKGVARSLGVSFREAMLEQRLGQQDYAGIVTSCRCCARVAECQGWLARNPHAKTAPDFCQIRDQLARLKPH